MKFGEYIQSNKTQEWSAMYIDYERLKDLIKRIHDKYKSMMVENPITTAANTHTSLSIPLPTNAAGMPMALSRVNEGGGYGQEAFYNLIDTEMKKIENFTKAKVIHI